MIPKNPGIAQKGTQKSESNPKKVPKIMAHPRIATYAKSISIPQNLNYSERNQILPKMIPKNPGIAERMIPKNPEIAQKDTQKSGSNPKKYPK